MSELSRRGFIGTALAGSAVPALSAAGLQVPEEAQSKVTVESNVVYGKAGEMELKLDIYLPPAGVSPKRMATIHFMAAASQAATKSPFRNGSSHSPREAMWPLPHSIVWPDRLAIRR